MNQQDIDDLKDELESAQLKIEDLEEELRSHESVAPMEAFIYTSVSGSDQSLVAKFSNAEEALMCLPALSRILRQRLYLTSEKSLGIINPLPDRCACVNSGVMFTP